MRLLTPKCATTITAARRRMIRGFVPTVWTWTDKPQLGKRSNPTRRAGATGRLRG